MIFVAALSAPQIEPTKAGTPTPDVPATNLPAPELDPDDYENSNQVYDGDSK